MDRNLDHAGLQPERISKVQSHRVWLWSLAVVFTSIICYLNAFGNEFVRDDIGIIKNNRRIQSLSDLGEIFATNYWGTEGNQGLYRPLVLVTYALNYAVGDLETEGYTAVNIGLHAAVCVLLLRLAVSLGAPVSAAGIAGLLFAVHPVHTESVTGFVGRAELLCALFFLAALLAHRRISSGWVSAPFRVVSAGAFALALLSKENAITFVGVVVAMDWIVPSRDDAGKPVSMAGRLRTEYLVYAIVAAAYLGVRHQVLGALTLGKSALTSLANPLVPVQEVMGITNGATDAERIMTATGVITEVLRVLVWPMRLSMDYSFKQIPLVTTPTEWRFLVGLVVMAATFGGVLFLRRRAPVLSFGLALQALTYSITSNLLVLIGTIFAERLLYLSSAGFLLVCAMAWTRCLAKVTPSYRSAASGLLAVVMILAGVRTWYRNTDWHDSLTLWEATAQASPQSARARRGLGMALLGHADEIRNRKGFDAALPIFKRAEQHLTKSLQIYPVNNELALNSLANLYMRLGDLDAMILLWERFIGLTSANHAAYTNLGATLMMKGRKVRQEVAGPSRSTNQAMTDEVRTLFEKALAKLNKAIDLNPTYAPTYYYRGLIYLSDLGNPARGVADFRQALMLDPNHPRRDFMKGEIENYRRR